jgi:hypothetical protein
MSEAALPWFGSAFHLVTVIAVAAGHSEEKQPDEERRRDRRVPSQQDHRRTMWGKAQAE